MSEIFLSYAHRDDLLPEGWVKQTKKLLQLRLDQLYGKSANKIFIDYERKGNQELPVLIRSQLKKAKVLLSVVSPSYFESKWCRREIDIFHELNGGNAYERIVRVDKIRPNQEHEIINALSLQIYKKFYDEDGEFFIDHQQETYRKEIFKLARALKDLLDEINKELHEVETLDKIFFPDCPDDKTVYLDMIKSGVFGNQFHQAKTPFFHKKATVADWQRDTQRDVVGCKCIVHILGENYGLIPDDSENNPDGLSVFELQYDAIKKVRETNRFFHIVWKPRGLKTSDSKQNAFINKLETSHSSSYHFAEFVEKDIVDFQNYLKEKIKQFENLETVQVPTTPTVQKRPVYFLFPYAHEEIANQFKAAVATSNLDIDLKIVLKDLGEVEKHALHKAYCDNIGSYIVMPINNNEFRGNFLGELIPKAQLFHSGTTISLEAASFGGHEFYILNKSEDPLTKALQDFCAEL